jgi:CubicO group peptidase (beta-lactamase class C family)
VRVLKLIGKGLLWLVAALVGVMAVAAIAAMVADPAVLKNMFFGPKMGDVTQIARAQPQEAVPGTERDDIATGLPDTIDPQALATAEAYAAKTNSVALLVYHRGALRYEKYWPGYDRNFRTDPFSAHKTVMGLLVGAAIQDGLIKSVEEPAATYLPEWRNDERAKIRIKDLLQMSSGLELPVFGTWRGLRITFGSDLPPSVLGLKAAKPSGTDFQYSNAQAQLLGIVLQNATGKRYAQYLSERLWSRIGAPAASVWLDHEGGMPRTFCCLYTTARGWLQVGRLMMDGGRSGGEQVVPESWIQEMTTPAATNPNYGYQVWLGSPAGTERKYNDKTVKAFHSEPYVAADIRYVDGFGGQRVYMVPSQELIIVRTGEAVFDWDDAVIPNAILRGLRAAAPAAEGAASAATSEATTGTAAAVAP